MNALRRFLESLPKPCAVFAANDKTGEQVLSAARMSGLDVPNDIAVIGVDNFEPICEHTTPPLSSVEPDFRLGGETAALMLLAAAMSKGRFRGSRIQTFGPLRIVRRASSRLLRRNDQHVADAIDLIRREACCGLRSSRVAALFPCSRRMADIRFAKATGHSILAEIHAVQLDRAKQLLKNNNMPLKAISDFCGFVNSNSLRKFFRKETGMSMSRWRASIKAVAR
jgi:LacI family transcriptional regulator